VGILLKFTNVHYEAINVNKNKYGYNWLSRIGDITQVQSDHNYTCLDTGILWTIRCVCPFINIKGVDVVEWSRALDVRLSEWCAV
jgi:hypothetical protein